MYICEIAYVVIGKSWDLLCDVVVSLSSLRMASICCYFVSCIYHLWECINVHEKWVVTSLIS